MSEEHPSAPAEPILPATEPAAAPGDAVAAPPPPATEPGPAESAAAEPAAPEAPAAPEIKPHTDEPGLLRATEASEPAPIEGEKPAEPPVSEPPVYEFAVPEGLTIAEDRLAELREVMTEGNVGKEHAEKLWAMHTAAMQEFQAQTLQAQHDAWGNLRRDWRTEIARDPELGGAGYKTNQAAANRMLDLFTQLPALNESSAEERTGKFREEINQFLSTTGATDHPAIFRLLTNIARKFDEPQSGPPPSPGPPKPGIQRGKAPDGGNSRLGYTHPRGGSRTE